MKKQSIIKFENVNFNYNENTPILKNLNFEIFDNEYVCIIGHNGSGKSTISKLLVGLLKPQTGTIKIFVTELNLTNLKKIRNNVGIVFQNPDNQFVGLSVQDDIAFGLENRKVPYEQMNKIINLAAKSVGIENLLNKSSDNLSGGQKQKVAIASILAINPQIMIFDESTSMLDPKSKNKLKKLMYDLKSHAKKTIISITHDMEEVINADRVIVINKGAVVLNDNPKNIFNNNLDIHSHKLDFPFIYQLSYLLNQLNPNIELTFDKKELINQLCHKK